MNRIHYLDPHDVIVCGCAEGPLQWTFASGRVTCPDCLRILEVRRGRGWIGDVADATDARRKEPPMDYTCDACGTSKAHDSRNGRVPLGWRFQWIGKRVVVLCDACGFLSPRNRASTVLIDLLRARGIDVDESNR